MGTNNIKELLAQELFVIVAKQLKEKLDRGEYTHQDMKNAIEFLKNNNITTDINSAEVASGLLEELDLPFANTEVN